LQIVPHNAHFDIYGWHVDGPTNTDPVGHIFFGAEHKEKKQFSVSFHDGRPGRFQVTASFLGTEQSIKNEKKPDGVDESIKLPMNATDVKIRYTLGDPVFTESTLAFLAGSPGDLTEADLSLGTSFFVEDAEFLVPMLYDKDGIQNLFVAVDLTQWLSFFTPFSVGEEFTISGGVSPLLPGFLVSTTEIGFDPAIGFTTNNPATLTVVAGGTIDGRTVPFPSTAAMLTAGLAFLALLTRWRRPHVSRNTSRHPDWFADNVLHARLRADGRATARSTLIPATTRVFPQEAHP
jgi:hypothetical protein